MGCCFFFNLKLSNQTSFCLPAHKRDYFGLLIIQSIYQLETPKDFFFNFFNKNFNNFDQK